MKFSDGYNPRMRGEFELKIKDKQGNIVESHIDHNVVVNDARTVTAFLVNQAILSGANRRETDDSADTGFESDLIGSSNVQVSFMKLGGGFPRKRSYCDTSQIEAPLIPSSLADGNRSSLWTYYDFGSTFVDLPPDKWIKVGDLDSEQPYHSSSLLYPKDTDIDIVDRDYQWAKKILYYRYTGDFAKYGENPTQSTFKAKFTTVMRFSEGNGPVFNQVGKAEDDNKKYEYREAGLYMGVPRWLNNSLQDNEANIKRHPEATHVTGHLVETKSSGALIDDTLNGNLRQYRFWDGHSSLMSNIPSSEYSTLEANWEPNTDSKLTWESSLTTRGHFKSINGSHMTYNYNENFAGTLYDGYLMLARKTFPTVTKTKDLEFVITWSLTFG